MKAPADLMWLDRVSWLRTGDQHRIRLEAATICQLACPSCPTTQGVIKAQIGAGFLKFDQFRRIVDDNPRISEIELSNWGEIFLNPDIERIIEYAYRRNVALSAWNGCFDTPTARRPTGASLRSHRSRHVAEGPPCGSGRSVGSEPDRWLL